MGLFPLFEQWKRDVVDIVARGNHDLDAERRIVLLDFAGYNSVTEEPVPAQGTGQRMRWFRDSAHYTVEAGSVVLALLLNPEESHRVAPGGFGVLLTRENIDEHLAAVRSAQRRYRTDFADEVQDVERLARATAEERARRIHELSLGRP